MSPRICVFLSAVLGLLSVALGAFGAHGLANNQNTGFLETKYATMEPKLIAGHSVPASFKYLQDFKTGVEYQMSHSLALAVTGLLMLRRPTRSLSVAAVCFLGGIFFFSGSLYVLVIGGPRWLGVPWGAVTPIGGTLMIVGWFALAIGSLRTLAKPFPPQI
jgi:uncharacterized membrane protein YgdD (TMEM256/DUF423 family)